MERAKGMGLEDPAVVLVNANILTTNSTEVYNNVTYTLDKDFEITCLYCLDGNVNVKLHLGNNKFPGQEISEIRIHEMGSIFLGKAYAIQAVTAFGSGNGNNAVRLMILYQRMRFQRL